MKMFSFKNRIFLLIIIVSISVLVACILFFMIYLLIIDNPNESENNFSEGLFKLDTVSAIIAEDDDNVNYEDDFNNFENEYIDMHDNYDNHTTSNSHFNANYDDGLNHNCEHAHCWLPHYSSKQEQVGTIYIVDQEAVYKSVTCCNVCGAQDVIYGVHQCNGGCFSSHTERILIQKEIGHYDPVFIDENFIDYYYCQICNLVR